MAEKLSLSDEKDRKLKKENFCSEKNSIKNI